MRTIRRFKVPGDRKLDVSSGHRHYPILVITFSNQVAMESDNAYGKIATSFLDSFHVVAN